jgi:Zn finger protein HypA/HybF involved in hydrogenase expression
MPCKVFTLEQIQAASEDMNGFCTRCGHEQGGCEPDAREYTCEACGEAKVYGAEELALMGLVV